MKNGQVRAPRAEFALIGLAQIRIKPLENLVRLGGLEPPTSAAKCLVTVFRDYPVRRAISRIDSFCRKYMRRMTFKGPMWITPLPPPSCRNSGLFIFN